MVVGHMFLFCFFLFLVFLSLFSFGWKKKYLKLPGAKEDAAFGGLLIREDFRLGEDALVLDCE